MTAHADALADLARAHGVMTAYADYQQRDVEVGPDAVVLALRAMGVEADDEAQARESLEAHRSAEAARLVVPTVVLRDGASLRLDPGTAVDAALVTEDGEERDLGSGPAVTLPADLPLGYHRLRVRASSADEQTLVAVVPERCPMPLTQPGWGWMVQLYQARSRDSWGMGDYADLRDITAWAGGSGAAMVLVNPLHAANPTLPQTDSPYYPSSRRFRSPLYLRIEDIPEVEGLSAGDRDTIRTLAGRAGNIDVGALIDRDPIFTAKMEAFELLAAVQRSSDREEAFAAWRRAEGEGARDFATFCALAERHGTPWQGWPAALRHPEAPAVARAREELVERVAFHEWLQWLCDTQLEAVDDAARSAGMPVGVIHDLAVGVDPGGADGWALRDDLALGVTVGAPPDGFNQQGQDWRLPPLLPGRLRETRYAPFRNMVRSVLRHAGGIRIDHVMGLWRLWWVPEGRSAAEGTYVRYPADDLLGILALEASRAGALVVGEDLGTVEKGVRETLAERGVLSSRVVYFERVDEDPRGPMLAPAAYPEQALTSITTHDLPTPAGWWNDEEIVVQTRLGLFGESTTPEAEAARKAGERADMLTLLRGEGLVGDEPTADELVLALHELLARTPSVLIATGLGDALGDRRQPNLPGTTDEYPSWRLPLSRSTDGEAQPLWLDEILADPQVARVAAVLAHRG